MACCGRAAPVPPIFQPDPLPNIWSWPSPAGLVVVPLDKVDEVLDRLRGN